MSLKLYSALIKKDVNNKIEDISLIKGNFSVSAFLFSFFWFLCHAMWKIAAIFLVVEVLLIKLSGLDYLNFSEILLLQIIVLCLIGLNATNLYSKHLQNRKGYDMMGYVLAENEEEARLKAMKSWHRNSPDLSFDEFSEDVIDPDFYLKSIMTNRGWFKRKNRN